MFHKYDDGEVEMVVFVNMDGILAHVQATMERGSPLSLEERFKLKPMVEKFGVEKPRRTPASSGVPPLSSSE